MRKHIRKILIVLALLVVMSAPMPAQAQTVEYGCETYGCLYEHCPPPPDHYSRPDRVWPDSDHFERPQIVPDHYERPTWQNDPCPLGISVGPLLPDGGPDNRRFVRVLWPGRYDPTRRPAWDRLAHCESTGNWSINTGNGYYGGLQFSLSSWRAAGGQQYALYPHQARAEEQISTAERLLEMQGRSAWPGCLHKGQGAPHPQ